MYECRCDKRLKTKAEESTRLAYTGVARGTGTPKDVDEVNRREVCQCDSGLVYLQQNKKKGESRGLQVSR